MLNDTKLPPKTKNSGAFNYQQELLCSNEITLYAQ